MTLMTDVAGGGGEVLNTQDRALVPESLGCWASFPWREDEGTACGDVSVPPVLSKVGAVFLQSLSSVRCPGIRELEKGEAPRKPAAAGRSRPKALLGGTAPHYRALPKDALWFPAPLQALLLDILAWIRSLLMPPLTLRREHPASQGLIQF